MRGTVAAVSCNDVYSFTKPDRDEIVLIAGLGVAGDVHAGVTVRHRSRVAADPGQPNLRQVHLIHSELHDELNEAGYEVPAGGLGENVTTTGIDLLALPVGTVLRFGPADPFAAAAAAVPAPEPAADAGSAPAREAGAASAVVKAAIAVWPSGAGPSSVAAAVAEDGAAVGPSGAGSSSVGSAVAEAAVPGPADGAAAVIAAAERASLDRSAANAVAALAARLTAEQADGRLSGQADGPVGGQADGPVGGQADGRLGERAGSPLGGQVVGRQREDTGQVRASRPAIVVTGLRNPCQQINHYRPGLLKRVLGRAADGSVIRRAGVMAVVLHGGPVRPGDEIHVELPALPHVPLDRV